MPCIGLNDVRFFVWWIILSQMNISFVFPLLNEEVDVLISLRWQRVLLRVVPVPYIAVCIGNYPLSLSWIDSLAHCDCSRTQLAMKYLWLSSVIVAGCCPLTSLTYVDYDCLFLTDSLHTIYGGAFKELMDLLLDSQYRNEPWSLFKSSWR